MAHISFCSLPPLTVGEAYFVRIAYGELLIAWPYSNERCGLLTPTIVPFLWLRSSAMFTSRTFISCTAEEQYACSPDPLPFHAKGLAHEVNVAITIICFMWFIL